jgi:hypothetical protein
MAPLCTCQSASRAVVQYGLREGPGTGCQLGKYHSQDCRRQPELLRPARSLLARALNGRRLCIFNVVPARTPRRYCERADRLALLSVCLVLNAFGWYAALQFFLEIGSQQTPMTMPTKMPRNVSPVCHSLNPWLSWKMSAKAPKKR